MSLELLKPFRLVGGTSLSLALGHKISVDIDMFTDAEYQSIDFKKIEHLFQASFSYFEPFSYGNTGPGKSYYIGDTKDNAVKVDLFYTDPFVFKMKNYEGIRIASVREIIAMKLEVIANNGRKKDFWDLHELMERFTWDEMLGFYKKRYPNNYSREQIIEKLTFFEEADNDFNPICLKGKYWELIKLDIVESVSKII